MYIMLLNVYCSSFSAVTDCAFDWLTEVYCSSFSAVADCAFDWMTEVNLQ